MLDDKPLVSEMYDDVLVTLPPTVEAPPDTVREFPGDDGNPRDGEFHVNQSHARDMGRHLMYDGEDVDDGPGLLERPDMPQAGRPRVQRDDVPGVFRAETYVLSSAAGNTRADIAQNYNRKSVTVYNVPTTGGGLGGMLYISGSRNPLPAASNAFPIAPGGSFSTETTAGLYLVCDSSGATVSLASEYFE